MKKNKKLVLGICVSIITIAVLAFAVPHVFAQTQSTGSFNYIPQEKIPGSESNADVNTFPGYVQAIYKFGIWAVGIAALLMIIVGGFFYMTAAGNTANLNKAKTMITDAFLGLVVALGAYLILYIINPDLVNINLKSLQNLQVQIPHAAPSTSVSGSQVNPATCTGCTQINTAINSNAYGVDANVLKALFVGGEGCNSNKSSAGACGFSQTMPKIRAWCGISGTADQTCSAVQNDTQLDANCGAKLLAQDMMRRCGSDIRQLASCYNTGKPNNCANAQNNYCDRVANFLSSCNK